jgi:serine protease
MSIKFSVAMSVLIGFLTIRPSVQAQEPLIIERDKVFASYGVVVPKSISLFPIESQIGKVFEQVISQQGTTSLRLHFQVQSAPQTPSWAVRVLDTTRAELWSYSSVSSTGADFWSRELPRDRVIVEIYSVQVNSPLKLAIDKIAVSAPPVTPKSITPPDQRVDIESQSAETRQWGRSVARLRFIGDDGRQYLCTGFLVSSDLLLTNHHCIKSDSEMRSALVDFDYDSSAASPTTLQLRELVAKDPELDFALLRLAESPGRQALSLDSTEPDQDQALLVIQHPAGLPKQVSILDCRVNGTQVNGLSSRATDFGHLCDTLGGSSGSPVQATASGKVIGLHHLGFRSGSDKLFNQAVKIGLIVQFLRDNNSALLGELGIR